MKHSSNVSIFNQSDGIFQHCIGILHLHLFNTLALGDLFRNTNVGVFKLAWFVGIVYHLDT